MAAGRIISYVRIAGVGLIGQRNVKVDLGSLF